MKEIDLNKVIGNKIVSIDWNDNWGDSIVITLDNGNTIYLASNEGIYIELNSEYVNKSNPKVIEYLQSKGNN